MYHKKIKEKKQNQFLWIFCGKLFDFFVAFFLLFFYNFVMQIFIEKLKPADVIAFFVLMFCMYIISIGVNHTVSGVVIMICTYYFVKKAQNDNSKTN